MPDYVVHLSTFLRFLELHIFYSGNEVDVNGEAVIPSKVGCNFFWISWREWMYSELIAPNHKNYSPFQKFLKM